MAKDPTHSDPAKDLDPATGKTDGGTPDKDGAKDGRGGGVKSPTPVILTKKPASSWKWTILSILIVVALGVAINYFFFTPSGVKEVEKEVPDQKVLAENAKLKADLAAAQKANADLKNQQALASIKIVDPALQQENDRLKKEVELAKASVDWALSVVGQPQNPTATTPIAPALLPEKPAAPTPGSTEALNANVITVGASYFGRGMENPRIENVPANFGTLAIDVETEVAGYQTVTAIVDVNTGLPIVAKPNQVPPPVKVDDKKLFGRLSINQADRGQPKKFGDIWVVVTK